MNHQAIKPFAQPARRLLAALPFLCLVALLALLLPAPPAGASSVLTAPEIVEFSLNKATGIVTLTIDGPQTITEGNQTLKFTIGTFDMSMISFDTYKSENTGHQIYQLPYTYSYSLAVNSMTTLPKVQLYYVDTLLYLKKNIFNWQMDNS